MCKVHANTASLHHHHPQYIHGPTNIDFFPFGGVGCRPPRTCCRLSTDLLSRLTFSSSLFSKSSTAGWKWSQKKHYSGFPKIWNWDSASLAFLSLFSFATLTEIWPGKRKRQDGRGKVKQLQKLQINASCWASLDVNIYEAVLYRARLLVHLTQYCLHCPAAFPKLLDRKFSQLFLEISGIEPKK